MRDRVKGLMDSVTLESMAKQHGEENKKGWKVVRLDPIDDDLTAVSDALLEKWGSKSRLLVVVDHTMEEELLEDQLTPMNELTQRMDSFNVTWFRDEAELEAYIDEVHVPEDGEV